MSNFYHDELVRILSKNYKNRFGKSPSQAADHVMDCIDDSFMNEYLKLMQDIETTSKNDLLSLQEEYRRTIIEAHQMKEELERLIRENNKVKEEIHEAETIQNQDVADALKVYQMIISMDFKDPQQKLQNIKNASYFIWALYAKGKLTPGEIFKDQSLEKSEKHNFNFDDPNIVWN